KAVAKQLEFQELYTRREEFREQILQVIGRDLNGFMLDDMCIDYLEQTPIDQLDPNNILDAQGIKRSLELTEQGAQTNPRPDSVQRPVFAAPPSREPSPLLPDAAELGMNGWSARSGNLDAPLRWQTSPLRLSLERNGQTRWLLELEQPLQATLAADSSRDQVSVQLRQKLDGQQVQVCIRFPAQALLDNAHNRGAAADVLESLPQLDTGGPTVSAAAGRQILSGLRWVMQAHGEERWG